MPPSARDPTAFETACLGWVPALATVATGQAVASAGETLRGSHDRANGRGPLRLASAWASANRRVLGRVAVDEKSDAIAAIPALLDASALTGGIVTTDAMGCQTAIAAEIVAARGADDVLAVGDNQPTPREPVACQFARVREPGDPGPAPTTHESVGKDHGRVEVRRCWATDDPAAIAWVDPKRARPGLRRVVAVEGERRPPGKTERETRHFLSGLPAAAPAPAGAARGHRGIANRVHWGLDVAFREDASRVRVGHAAENLAVLRHLAPNPLRQERSAKIGIAAKRLKAAGDTAHLRKVLAG